jgi:hypothetical protein
MVKTIVTAITVMIGLSGAVPAQVTYGPFQFGRADHIHVGANKAKVGIGEAIP